MAFIVNWIFWGTVGAILNGMIAQRKGRDVVVWLILGAVFGIFSTLVLAFLPKSTESGIYKKCPHCAETILNEAKVCRYCTKEITLSPLGSGDNDQDRQFEKQPGALEFVRKD